MKTNGRFKAQNIPHEPGNDRQKSTPSFFTL